MADQPRELRLEVKTSRSGTFQIGARDIEGVGAGGYVAALLIARLLHGPRWVLVPARELQVRGYREEELAEIAAPMSLAAEINRGWSDWIMDHESWAALLAPGILGVAERIAWCRREHPPRAHQVRGNVREVKLQAALVVFRAEIDKVASGESGSQAEGQVHQALLGDVLGQLSYGVTLNAVGVPDIVAKLPTGSAAAKVRDRLEHWSPPTVALGAARDALLDLRPDELQRLLEELC
jgi:hypothetical protein